MKAKAFASIAASDHDGLTAGHKFQNSGGRCRVKAIHILGAVGSFGHFRLQLKDGASSILLSDIESAGHSGQARYSWFPGAEINTGYVTGDLQGTRPLWDFDMEPEWTLHISLQQSGGYGGNIDSATVIFDDGTAAQGAAAQGAVSGAAGGLGVTGATGSAVSGTAAAADGAETVTFQTTLEATPPPPLAAEKPAPAKYDPAVSSATRELQGAAKQFSSLIPTLKALPSKLDAISEKMKEWTRPPPPPPGFTADLPAQLDADAARIAKEDAAAAKEQAKADKRAAWLLKSKPIKALGQDAMDLLADPTRTASQVRDGLDKLRADPRFVKLDAADRKTVSEYFAEIQKMGSKTTTGKPRGRPRKVKNA